MRSRDKWQRVIPAARRRQSVTTLRLTSESIYSVDAVDLLSVVRQMHWLINDASMYDVCMDVASTTRFLSDLACSPGY